jgi:hypothetical protein
LGSERDAISGTIEEAYLKIVFERFNLQRDRRLREKQLLGGFTEVEVFGNRAEDFQPKVFKLSHGRIIYTETILSPGDVRAGHVAFKTI